MASNRKARQNKGENVLDKTLGETQSAKKVLHVKDGDSWVPFSEYVTTRWKDFLPVLTIEEDELDLSDVIEWANWVPKDFPLQHDLIAFNETDTDASLTTAIEKLPEPLRSNLLKILHTPIAQGRIRNPRLYRRSGSAPFDDPEREALMRRALLLSRYGDIRRFRESLDLLLP